MSDPTIQTFCCYSTNETESTTLQMLSELNPDAYNAISLFSSTLGIFGAIYQILPRKEFSRNHRWHSCSAQRGRKIILWLAVSDLLASLGVFARALLWLNNKNVMPITNDHCSVVYCALSSAWIQYFYTATWIWTLCYAIDVRLLLKEKPGKTRIYHLSAWIIPGILTALGLMLLYYPKANCHTTNSLSDAVFKVLPNYIATYIPIAIVMIANPCLYHFSSKDMKKIITCTSGQFTKRERELLDAVKIKFSAINIVFYVCWIPNLINGILLWTLWFNLPVSLIITMWYIIAFMNPLQAMFNSLVYRRWKGDSEMMILPWSKTQSYEDIKLPTRAQSSSSQNEHLPLLQHFRSLNPHYTV